MNAVKTVIFFFLSRCRLILTDIKEQFVLSIKVFKSSQNNKERCNQGNIPITESHLKTSDCSLKTYLKVPGCMFCMFMKPSREDKKILIFFFTIPCIYFKKGKSCNTIDLMVSLHSLEVHDSVPGPTHKNYYLIGVTQTEKIKDSFTKVR